MTISERIWLLLFGQQFDSVSKIAIRFNVDANHIYRCIREGKDIEEKLKKLVPHVVKELEANTRIRRNDSNGNAHYPLN